MRHRWIKNIFCVLLLLSLLLTPALAATEGALPDGFSGMDSVTLEVDSSLPWRTPTEADEAAFGTLTDDTHQTVYLAGNSGTSEENVSNLAVTVSEPGKLTLDYRVSCSTNLNYMLAYSLGTQITLDNFKTVTSYSGRTAFQDNRDWTSLTLDITEDLLTDGPLTVYFAYVRNGTQDASVWADEWEHPDWLNYAAIANVSYASGSRTDLIAYEDGYSEAMGTVSAYTSETVTNEEGEKEVIETPLDLTAGVSVGQTLTLRIQAGSGYRFYGWVRNYYSSKGVLLHSFEGGGSDLTISVDADSTYTPVFAPEGAYVLRNGSTFYPAGTSLSAVLSATVRGDVVELLESAELTGDLTVPTGVTLYIPFRAEWGAEERTGAYHLSDTSGAQSIAGTGKAYVTLTIPEDTTLTVNGTLASGSVIGCTSVSGMQGHTSGAYGRIVNNGTILVTGTGTFTTWGITDGTGTVLAESGTTVKEPFIVCDFSGGSNTTGLFGEGQTPFKRFAMQNIQCLLQMERGSTLTGLCSLYAMGGYNEAEVSVVGAENALFRPNDTAVITDGRDIMLERTYDPTGVLTGDGVPTCTAGIGTVTWRVSGGLTFQSMTLDLFSGFISISTEDVDFPIPYNMEFVLENGKYVIPGRLKLMPGAKVTVAENATLDITGRLLVLDGLKQGPMSGKNYPSSAVLAANGRSQSGELIVNGTMTVAAGATLAGVVQTMGTSGMLIIEEGAYLTNSGDLEALDPALLLIKQTGYSENDWVQQDGALGTYSDNTTWFNLPARICVVGEDGRKTLVPLTPGVYRAAGADEFLLDSYTVLWCSNGSVADKEDSDYQVNGREMTLETVEINQTMTGVWTNSTAELEVTATTPYGENSAVNTSVIVETTANGTQYRLTVNVENKNGTELTQTYVHLVKYLPKGAQKTVQATRDADGTYLIPIDATDVTVESALLGDVNKDGAIRATDLLVLKQALTSKRALDELQDLIADCNGDGSIRATDLLKLKQYLTGKANF